MRRPAAQRAATEAIDEPLAQEPELTPPPVEDLVTPPSVEDLALPGPEILDGRSGQRVFGMLDILGSATGASHMAWEFYG